MRTKANYARKHDICRLVQAVESAGVRVGSIEILPDGTIRITDLAAVGGVPNNDEFARLEAAGKL